MDIAIKQGTAFDFENKLRTTVDKFRLEKIEKLLSDVFENLPDESPIDLIEELNRSDIMH